MRRPEVNLAVTDRDRDHIPALSAERTLQVIDLPLVDTHIPPLAQAAEQLSIRTAIAHGVEESRRLDRAGAADLLEDG